MKKVLILIGFILLVGISVFAIQSQKQTVVVQSPPVTEANPQPSSTEIATPQPIQLESHFPFPAPRTKTADCSIQDNLPDSECTPGAVTATSKEELCKTAQKNPNVSEKLKNQVLAEYGISSKDAKKYVIDFLIGTELGGKTDIANLWPQPVVNPGLAEKDKVEAYLYKQVCAGQISLDEAQKTLATNWLQELQATQE